MYTVLIRSRGLQIKGFLRYQELLEVSIPFIEHLRTLLNSLAHAQYIVFLAQWKDLTAEVHGQLAAWTMQEPSRGCGVLIAEDLHLYIDGKTRLINNGSSGWIRIDPVSFSSVPTSPGAFLAKEDSSSEILAFRLKTPVPTCLSITGHGAEYCIQYGRRWVSTYKDNLLVGEQMNPEHITVPLVFLNSCSGLRLGDSVVPKEFSLAASLWASGSTVIGAYSTLNTSIIYHDRLIELISSGMPIGRVVNALNIEALRQGAAKAPFLLLGDPTTVFDLPPACPTPNRLPISVVRMEELISESVWLLQCYLTLESWFDLSPQAKEAASLLRQCIRNSLSTLRVTTRFVVGVSANLESTEADIAKTLLLARIIILNEIESYIKCNGWIDQAYIRIEGKHVCEKTLGEDTLMNGSERSSHSVVPGMLSIYREETDSEGVITDRIGTPMAQLRPKYRTTQDKVEISLPSLPSGAIGRVFLHRVKTFSHEWPADGGMVAVASCSLPFRGRLTFVGTVIGLSYINIFYHNVFLPPTVSSSISD